MSIMLIARSFRHHSRLLARATHSMVPEETKTNQDQQQANDKDQLLAEVPIKGLDIVRRINKVSKKGSFSSDIFTGRYDHDFLTYPDPVDSTQELKLILNQGKMIRQMWPQYWDDDLELQRYNFFNMYQLSVTEMMSIFENIGASTRKCYETKLPKNHIGSNFLLQASITQSTINLIIRNCLTYWPIHNSENQRVKEILPRKHIVFGQPQSIEKPYLPVGFCWSEKAPNLGSLPPQEWFTEGTYGGDVTDNLLIQGRKTGVLLEDSTDHYLVYYRDRLLSQKYMANPPADESNPASDTFIGCALVHKSELKHSPIYADSAGFKYTDVEFDTTVPGYQIVFPAERNSPRGVNIKALGQVASCSVVLGILKDSLQLTYEHLLDHKEMLLNCDIIERKLVSVTEKIFAIESMVYYIAGMYDGLEEGFDAHMEATILKIVTNEYAYSALQELQQILGSDMFIISKLQDQINIFDSFLDGNIYNRLYLATMGVIWFARSKNVSLNKLRLAPWYPGYLVKHLVREKAQRGDWLTLDADIYGNLHPSLREAGANLEYLLKRVKYATENICMNYGENVTGAQSSLYDLAQLSIDSFVLTTLCARASKSYCNGVRYSETDVTLATHFSTQMVKRTRLYMDQIECVKMTSFFSQTKAINEQNMKAGGYYATSPLDPNV